MRKLGLIGGITFGVIVVLVVVLYFTLDLIAKYAITSAGGSFLGVPTTVGSVDIGVVRHSTSVGELRVANPSGFREPYVMQVDDLYVEGRLGTFLSSDIDIPVVRLKGFTFDLEQINQRMNVKEIVANISKEIEEEDQDDGGDDSTVRLNIQRLEILDITLTAEGEIVNVAGGRLDAKVPQIVLQDVGTESDEDKIVGHLVGVMMDILIRHIAKNPIRGLSDLAINQITVSIKAIPGLKQTGLAKPIADAVQHMGSGATDVISGIGEAVHGLGNAIHQGVTGSSPKSDDTTEPSKKSSD